MAHDHHHHHHGHPHVPGDPGELRANKPLFWAFLINLAFLLIEVAGGLLSGSMALLADAGHMLSDVLALGTAVWISRAMMKPATRKRTYGYGRLEVLSGFVNGIVLWGVVVFIVIEAVHRLRTPQPIDGPLMLAVAVAGLLANLLSVWILFAHRDRDLNLRSAFLHLAADAAGSIGAILAGVAILWGGWYWMDTAASVLIGLLIFISSIDLVRDSTNILLESTPPDVDLGEVRASLLELEVVVDVHDLHAWRIGSGQPMLTAHLIPRDGCDSEEVLSAAQLVIVSRYGIDHTTFQRKNAPAPTCTPSTRRVFVRGQGYASVRKTLVSVAIPRSFGIAQAHNRVPAPRAACSGDATGAAKEKCVDT